MTTATHTSEADRALKAKHRAIWASGDYERIVNEIVSPLGPVLVRAAGVRPSDRVLDVAAGTGSASLPAAELGARVVASDLTPELLEIGRRDAEARGLSLDWRTADAEALPFGDDEFDVVLSCIGVMFAPHHRASADELIRVCRPGGTISVLSWTPQGFIGQVFAAMKPFAPPPPPGAQPPPLWGDEDHVRELFGDRVTDVEVRRQTLEVTRFNAPEDFRDDFKTLYGPTIATYRHIADDPERVAALDNALAEVGRRFDRGVDKTVLDWEYLIVTARKR
ncbi:MAG TPA: class I SAM-dependent methyltransferase [Actinoplanes sp.]|nr:class I SAM-dependent methyltransferase [Actinoplanes sp.]